MPNWNQIAERIARGMYGQEWDRQDKAKQDLAESNLKMDLAKSGESRAARRFEDESEEIGYKRGRRGAQEEREAADLAGVRGRNTEQENQNATFTATGGAQGAATRLTAEERRKDTSSRNESTRVGYEGKRVKIAEDQAKEVNETRGIRDQLLEAELLSKRADLAVKSVADPGIAMLIKSLQAQHSDLMRAGDTENAAQVRDQLNAMLDRYAEIGKHMQEAQRQASNPLFGRSAPKVDRNSLKR